MSKARIPNEDGQDLRNLSAVIARNEKRIRELEAALTDMTRQRDDLNEVALGARSLCDSLNFWCNRDDLATVVISAQAILEELLDQYYNPLTPSDRARDAEAQAGMAAADEADHEAKIDRLLNEYDERIEFDHRTGME